MLTLSKGESDLLACLRARRVSDPANTFECPRVKYSDQHLNDTTTN